MRRALLAATLVLACCWVGTKAAAPASGAAGEADAQDRGRADGARRGRLLAARQGDRL